MFVPLVKWPLTKRDITATCRKHGGQSHIGMVTFPQHWPLIHIGITKIISDCSITDYFIYNMHIYTLLTYIPEPWYQQRNDVQLFSHHAFSRQPSVRLRSFETWLWKQSSSPQFSTKVEVINMTNTIPITQGHEYYITVVNIPALVSFHELFPSPPQLS